MKIIVRDNLGKDVTYDREWYIGIDGRIYYYTSDIDGPLYVVDNDYTWEVVDDTYNLDRFMYFVKDIDSLREHKANAKRIKEAVERTQKYIGKKDNYEEN